MSTKVLSKKIRREGGMEGKVRAEGNFTWGRNSSNIGLLIQLEVRHCGGGSPSNLGTGAPLPPVPPPMVGGGRAGGKEAGGRI